MSLLTRCPRCKTLFRLTPAQLQVRAGTVRCGRCMSVFDAYEALAVDKTPALSAPQEPVPAAAPDREAAPAPSAAGQAAAPMAGATAAAAALGRAIARPAPTNPATPGPAPAAPGAASGTPPASAPARVAGASMPAAVDAPAAASAASPEPLSQRLLRQPTPQQLWATAAVGAAILLVLQLAFAYRSDLVARYPVMRSAFTWICGHAGCRVTLPHRPQLVRIEASDVHMTDAGRPQLIQLTATLRSYAGYDLAYPALDLVLTNATEHALARRIFLPEEYLDPSRDPQAGIPANAEITIALDLDTGTLNAAGFRLDLLAAPSR